MSKFAHLYISCLFVLKNAMYGSTAAGSEISPDLQRWFSAVDRDGSGRITAKELQSVLANGQGGTFSDTACKLMIGMLM